MAVEAGLGGIDDGRREYGDSKGLMELMADHDKNTSNFHDLLHDLGSKPLKVSASIGDVNLYGAKVFGSWVSVVDRIADNRSLRDEEFIAELSAFWVEDDSRRLAAITEIAPDCPVKHLADGEPLNLKHMIIAVFDDLAEYYDGEDLEFEYAQSLKKSYVEYFESDVNSFLSEVTSQSYLQSLEAEMSRRDKIKHLLPRLGGHAIDAAKVALGVSAGVIIGSLFRKKD